VVVPMEPAMCDCRLAWWPLGWHWLQHCASRLLLRRGRDPALGCVDTAVSGRAQALRGCGCGMLPALVLMHCCAGTGVARGAHAINRLSLCFCCRGVCTLYLHQVGRGAAAAAVRLAGYCRRQACPQPRVLCMCVLCVRTAVVCATSLPLPCCTVPRCAALRTADCQPNPLQWGAPCARPCCQRTQPEMSPSPTQGCVWSCARSCGTAQALRCTLAGLSCQGQVPAVRPVDKPVFVHHWATVVFACMRTLPHFVRMLLGVVGTIHIVCLLSFWREVYVPVGWSAQQQASPAGLVSLAVPAHPC
jgi:hypothetical protein